MSLSHRPPQAHERLGEGTRPAAMQRPGGELFYRRRRPARPRRGAWKRRRRSCSA